MKITVYHKEIAFIACVLVVPFFFAPNMRTTELIAAAAVFFTFLHAQMSNRMQDRMLRKTSPSVKGSWKIVIYQILKEGL